MQRADRRNIVLVVLANDRYGQGSAYLRDLVRERREIEDALEAAVDAAPRPAPPDPARVALLDQARRQGSACDCRAMDRTLLRLIREHGHGAGSLWNRHCARPIGRSKGGLCARSLRSEIDDKLAACACSPSTSALVTRMKADFGVDLTRTYRERCELPGLETSCVR